MSLNEYLASSPPQEDGQPCFLSALGLLSEAVYFRHLVSTVLPLWKKKGQSGSLSSPEPQGEMEMGSEGLVFTLILTHLLIHE